MIKGQTFITEEGYKKLKKELEDLRNDSRVSVAKKIQEAREMGGVEENPAYDIAVEQFGYIEGRISEIEEILANSTIAEVDKGSSIVELGANVVVEFSGKKDTFKIVSSVEADPTKRLISVESPVGKALLGAKKGDVVVVKTPVIVAHYKIIEIK
ncbi:MAG: transcription elongation factor GreA [Niabella sp.]|nr:MAG: transcription elongation factor GreA [Niabella sp.]